MIKLFREKIRKLKYKLKFYNTNKKNKFNYISNSLVSSDLTNLMNKYGSDKGGLNNHHNYAEYYSFLFEHKRKDIKNLLEIGLGTNDVSLASNMGEKGVPLASLRAWKEYFPNAEIIGADIDKKILKNEDRIKTFYVDQTNPASIKEMFDKIGIEKYDIILEDGLHEFNANICFFENSIKYLSKNGTYIIEDIYFKDQEKFINYFENLNYNFSIIDIYHKTNIANNCLILITKRNNEK
tara:strand:- start:11 stop:724 length:714 start_codon:yes stop_codon:yes gene_type:complete